MSKAPFSTITEFKAILQDLPVADAAAKEAATQRNGVLTKPPGALGRLEDIAIWYASWVGDAAPQISAPQIVVFAGNHGVTAQGISAFPSEVTVQMVANFEAGGAAINQLASFSGSKLDVIALDLDKPTRDFTNGPAMDAEELIEALQSGWNAVDSTADLFVAGEMGIGNTTSAAAIVNALFGGDARDWVGPGTGLDSKGVSHKAEIVAKAVSLHGSDDPIEVLRCLGGREIAAMVGAFASARFQKIPVILDGFIASAAAAVLHQSSEGSLDHMMAAHLSEENAHGAVLKSIALEPILDLGLRLGEGSGAALAIQIVKGAVACHSGMATFAEAGVSDG